MKHRTLNIVAILLFIAGLAIFFCPIGANYLYEHKVQGVISGFDEAAQELRQAEKELAQSGEDPAFRELYTDMQAYNLNLYENGQDSLQDPFSYETPAFDLTGYGLEENIVGYISIPRMDVKLPIYLGASTADLALGVGNLGYTSIPIGGTNTNTVLAGHRGYRCTAMFRDIEALQIGDKVYVTNFWDTLVYEVAETKVILPTDIQKVYIQEGRDMVTLITCHPYTKNYQRYVVYCERMEAAADIEEADTTARPDLENIFHWNELSVSEKLIFVERRLPAGVAVLLLLFIAIKLILWVFRRHKRRLSG